MSSLVYIPLRKTTTTSIAQGLRQCIDTQYNQHPDKYAQDLDALDALRDGVVNATETAECLPQLMEYFVQLYALEPKFPSETTTTFTWYNTLSYAPDAPVQYSTIYFDQINVAFNIAALYTAMAIKQSQDEAEGLKAAYQAFQQAAGSFDRLLTDFIQPSTVAMPIGLDVETIATLRDLCLAQAQECFWRRATMGQMKDSLVAKLLAQVYDFYAACLQHANRSNSIRSEWIHHITCKMFHFEGAMHYRLARDAMERGNHGIEVARLQACVAACDQGLLNSKYVASTVLDHLMSLKNKASTDLVTADRDNELIYHLDVPRIQDLAVINRGAAMTQPIVPPALADPLAYLKNSVGRGAYFQDLMPYSVYQAAKVYREKIEDYLHRNVQAKADQLSDQLRSSIAAMDLPGSLDAVEKPLGVPEQVLQYSDDLRAQGGVQRLESALRDVAMLAKQCQNLITEIKQTLDKEDQEDQMMRMRLGTDRWQRPPSSEEASDLVSKLQNYQNYLTAASQSDELLRDKFESVNGLLQVLERGRTHIARYIPNTRAVALSPESQQFVTDLRRSLARSRGMIDSRQQYVDSLMGRASRLDLLPSVVKLYEALQHSDPHTRFEASQFEVVYTEMIQGYGKHINWVAEQAQHQQQLLESITAQNDQFVASVKADPTAVQRQQAIQSLEVAHNQSQHLRKHLDEGRRFYNTLAANLKELLSQAKAFVHERRLEGGVLESQISGAQVPMDLDMDPDLDLDVSMSGLSIQRPSSTLHAPRAKSAWKRERFH